MDTRQTRRILIVAFVVSLLVHAIVALVVHGPFVAPRDEPQIVTLEKRPRMLRVSHATPPPPLPQPTIVPTRAPAARVPILAHHSNERGDRPAVGIPAAVLSARIPTPLPQATPTTLAAGACARPNAPPAMLGTPVPAEIAPSVRAAANDGVTRLIVALDARGAVTGTSVTVSSGNTSLDAVATTMARASRYAPAYQNCTAIAGQYLFSASFVAF